MLENEHLRGGNKWVLDLDGDNDNGFALKEQSDGVLMGVRLWWCW